MTTSSPTTLPRSIPHVDVLCLGDPGVGKATFLSRLPSVQHPSIAKRTALSSQPESSLCANKIQLTSPSTTTLLPQADEDIQPPAYTSTVPVPEPPTSTLLNSPASHVHPLSGPLTFSVSLFARPYSITIHPSTTQLFTDPFPTDPPPRFAIIAYSIPDRVTLHNARNYWTMHLRERYADEEGMRVMLLGLKRDLRTDRKVPRRNWESHRTQSPGSGSSILGKGAREVASIDPAADTHRDWEYECVMPEEGLQFAREVRADRYAECSALTGELMWQVLEDITRTAARTTVEEGREGSGSCVVI